MEWSAVSITICSALPPSSCKLEHSRRRLHSYCTAQPTRSHSDRSRLSARNIIPRECKCTALHSTVLRIGRGVGVEVEVEDRLANAIRKKECRTQLVLRLEACRTRGRRTRTTGLVLVLETRGSKRTACEARAAGSAAQSAAGILRRRRSAPSEDCSATGVAEPLRPRVEPGAGAGTVVPLSAVLTRARIGGQLEFTWFWCALTIGNGSMLSS